MLPSCQVLRRQAQWVSFAVFCVLAPRVAEAAPSSCNDFEARTFNDALVNLPYRLYVPPGYDEAQEYPLILALHGAGERGNDNCNQINGQSGGLVFLSDAAHAAHPAFMVYPQCPADQQWVDTPWSEGSYVLSEVPISNEMTVVIKMLDALQAEFSIDPDRVYVTGISMGGFGTWDIVMRYPDRFAAAIPLSGGASPTSASLIQDLPIWNFHGATDGVVPTQASRDMVDALEALGSPIEYTEYASGHDSWTQQYLTAGLVDWLFTQVRSEGAGGEGPTGGTGGTGGGGASSGGAAGKSAGGSAGVASNGGATSAGGAASGGGGASSTGGAAGQGGKASNAGSDSESDSGCSVAFPGAGSSAAWSMGLVVAAASLLRRRRQRG